MAELPELISDVESEFELESDFEDDSFAAPLSHRERHERKELMELVVSITARQLSENRSDANSTSIARFLNQLLTRSRTNFTQFINSIVILQRLAHDESIVCDSRRLVLFSFVLGHGSIDLDLWSRVTGLPRSSITAGLVDLGHSIGGLQQVSTVSTDDMETMSHLLKAEVKRYVKVI